MNNTSQREFENTHEIMLHTEDVLNSWKELMHVAGIGWYLFASTLLCAEVAHEIPDNSRELNVAVWLCDLPKIQKEILPILTQKFSGCVTEKFSTVECLCTCGEKKVLLKIWLLDYALSEDEADCLLSECKKQKNIIDKIDKKTFGRIPAFLKKVLCAKATRVCTSIKQRRYKKSIENMNQSFPYVINLWNMEFTYSMPVEWFKNQYDIELDGIFCPVFSGYKEYLSIHFLDYENCFEDPIGCYLTIEEKEDLKMHQRDCIEALENLERLCQEYNLKYRLIAGSVLGAVRHQGFIPWDDDIDVGIRAEDREMLERILEEHLPEKFELIQPKTNVYYPRMFAKICCNGRCCIDLFPLVPTPKGKFMSMVMWKMGRFFRKMHYVKINHYHDKDFRFKVLARFLAFFISDEQIMRLERRYELWYANKKEINYMNVYSIYTPAKETSKYEWVTNIERMTFEGINVPVMGCTEEYLTHMYGDYMQMPMPWERTHSHTARFSK